jgi:voltage-gated potassium channel
MMVEYPYYVISVLTVTVTIILSYVVRIAENGEVIHDDGSITVYTDFIYFSNSIWYIYVTYAIIGYGDFVPQTTLGRIVGFATALCGNCLISLSLVMIQEKLSLNRTQYNVNLNLTD